MKTLIRFATGLLFLSGILILVWLTRANSRLADEVSQLEAEFGRLSIEDVDQVHIVAMKEPRVPPEVAPYVQRVWQYRLYLPAGYDFRKIRADGRVTEDGLYFQGSSGSSSSSPKKEATQSVVSLSLSTDGDQTRCFFSMTGSGSGTTSWGRLDPELLLSDDLVVQTLSTPLQGSRSFDQDVMLPLLKVYDPKTSKKKTIAGSEITTYTGGLIVLCPKSRQSAMDELQKGRVPDGFEQSWIAKRQRDE